MLWRTLTLADRSAAADALWRGSRLDADGQIREQAIEAIAAGMRLRPQTARRSPHKSEYLAKTAISHRLAEGLLRIYLLDCRTSLLAAFLDRLGIAHDRGLIGGDVDLSRVDGAMLQGAARELMVEFGAADCRLYFSVLVQPGCLPVWEPLGRVLAGPDEPPAPPEPASEPEPLAAGGAIEHFTTLDQTAILAIISAHQEIEGSLSPDQCRDLAEELCDLNLGRHRSFYVRGLYDALFSPALADQSGTEQDRRLWYLAGAVVGLARCGAWQQIAHLALNGELDSFGREPNFRTREALPHVVTALRRCGQAGSLVRLLDVRIVAWANLFESLLEEGTGLLRAGGSDDAWALLGLLHRSLPSFDVPPPPDQIARLERRRAHAARMRRDFAAAKEIVDDQLKDADVPQRSFLLTDRAMASQGFRGLFEVALPPDESELPSVRERLDAIKDALVNAEQAAGDPAHASYCLGVAALCRERCSHQEVELAAARLSSAEAFMARSPDAYRSYGLLRQAQFYLALAYLESLDSSRQAHAADLFAASLEDGFRPPAYALRRVCEAIAAAESHSSADRIAEAAFRHLGHPCLDALSALPWVPRAVLDAMLAAALDPTRSRKTRAGELQLVAGIATRQSENDVLESALDELEALARLGFGRAEFIQALSERRYDPAWTPSEVTWCLIGLLEAEGRYAAAASLLEQQFHQAISHRQDPDEAADILAGIERYGCDYDTRGLRVRLDAELAKQAPAPPPPSGPPVRILVVGALEGHTVETAVREHLALAGGIELEFAPTGWGSNWGAELARLDCRLRAADAIVVLRLIRTHLGRELRKAKPGRWIGCGGAPLAIAQAVRRAADVARHGRVRGHAAGG